jgi:hypothetical protein
MYYDDPPRKFREIVMAYASGVLFAVAWWLWIDAVAYSVIKNDPVQTVFGHWIPGIVSTVALLMINAVNWSDLYGLGFSSVDSELTRVRVWLFVSFVIAFGGIIAAVWIACANWFVNEQTPFTQWPGIALILQNVFIFISGILYRFAKPPPEEYQTF